MCTCILDHQGDTQVLGRELCEELRARLGVGAEEGVKINPTSATPHEETQPGGGIMPTTAATYTPSAAPTARGGGSPSQHQELTEFIGGGPQEQ